MAGGPDRLDAVKQGIYAEAEKRNWPTMTVVDHGGTPILDIGVGEHAWRLAVDSLHSRDDYLLHAIFDQVKKVEARST